LLNQVFFISLHQKYNKSYADGRLSPDIEKSDVYDKTGHPCRLDFERFAERIGLPKKRAASVLDMFMEIPPNYLSTIRKSIMFESKKIEKLLTWVKTCALRSRFVGFAEGFLCRLSVARLCRLP